MLSVLLNWIASVLVFLVYPFFYLLLQFPLVDGITWMSFSLMNSII